MFSTALQNCEKEEEGKNRTPSPLLGETRAFDLYQGFSVSSFLFVCF